MSDDDGNTPLDPDEVADLIATHLTTRAQLNAWEQVNISLAVQWLERRRRAPVLTYTFLLELHQRMFDRTWGWAGRLRTTERNIGVAPQLIAESLAALLGDVAYWLQHATYPLDEIAARFHHRLVAIHPFANGNGRHARLAADALLEHAGAQPFSWGSGDRLGSAAARTGYLRALRRADQGELADLIAFVRS